MMKKTKCRFSKPQRGKRFYLNIWNHWKYSKLLYDVQVVTMTTCGNVAMKMLQTTIQMLISVLRRNGKLFKHPIVLFKHCK